MSCCFCVCNALGSCCLCVIDDDYKLKSNMSNVRHPRLEQEGVGVGVVGNMSGRGEREHGVGFRGQGAVNYEAPE